MHRRTLSGNHAETDARNDWDSRPILVKFIDSKALAHEKELDRFPVMASADSHSRAQPAASAT